MKANRLLTVLALSGTLLASCLGVDAQVKKSSTNKMRSADSYVIKTNVPVRPKGQKDVLQLRLPAMKVVRVGIIGL